MNKNLATSAAFRERRKQHYGQLGWLQKAKRQRDAGVTGYEAQLYPGSILRE
jgi:hypothetical protein